MKFIEQQCDYNFKPRVNPRTKATFNLVASRNYTQMPTYKIIERLKKTLFSRVAQNFAYPNAFTLLNVCNILAGVSYGFAKAPVNLNFRHDALAFTFALHPDSDLRYQGEPPFVREISSHVRYWGYNRENEFVTIYVDVQDVITGALTIRDYEYLYLIIGSVTKNFCLFKDVEQHSLVLDRNSIPSFYSTIYNLDLASLVYNVPYRQWVYCKQVWEDCPEIIAVNQINEYSALYYAVFLSSKTLTTKLISNMESAQHLLNELYKYYLLSQRMLISNQVGEKTIDEEHDYMVSFIYPAAVYCIFHMLNVPSSMSTGYNEWKPKARLSNFYEWLNGLTVRVQEDLYINPDIQFLAQIPNLCRDAIVNKLTTFRKAATILAGQVQSQSFTKR